MRPTTGYTGPKMAFVRKANGDVVTRYDVGPVVGHISALTVQEGRDYWKCRNCGAGVKHITNGCQLCGYERTACGECKGEGVLGVGGYLGPMPCPGCDDGFSYPDAA